ncbi:MAG: glycosyltransferase family 2 protein [Solobacterium sp.]|nr:glycosyltransferase family 2 protein [Solobacterium sp.]
MRVLIIVPAHNEEKALPLLIPKIQEYGWEYLVINDCSTDGTEKLLDEKHWTHIDLPLNAGLAAVTQMGFKYAAENGYDAAVVVDGDGQHPPKYIRSLVNELENGADYVVGSRFLQNRKPATMRMIGSRMICGAVRLKTGFYPTDPTSGMRAVTGKIIREFAEDMNYIAEPDALVHIIRSGYTVREVQVDMEERQEGVSYFVNPFKAAKYMFNILISILILQ